MHRTQILYFLFFLIFFVFADGEACGLPNDEPNLASGHECCSGSNQDRNLPTGKTAIIWSVTLDCHGDLCCCDSGGPQAVAAIRTGPGDHASLRYPFAVLHHVQSFPPAVVPVADTSPPIAFSPLYIRNCAFLI